MRGYMPQSKSDIHETPDRVYEIIQEKWGYEKQEMFDPCPVGWTQNGLEIEWESLNYVNPPYSILKDFVAKAISEAKLGNKTIMLLPSKTEQEWYHDLEPWHCNIMWIRKRLTFKHHENSATQPHFLVMIQYSRLKRLMMKIDSYIKMKE